MVWQGGGNNSPHLIPPAALISFPPDSARIFNIQFQKEAHEPISFSWGNLGVPVKKIAASLRKDRAAL
jgi:hypothetical protein